MVIKKTGGVIYGAILTNAEKKAMRIEIDHEMAERLKKDEEDIDSAFLWEMHTQLHFGKKRLKRFYQGFKPVIDALIKRYELGESDKVWLCKKQLKDIGVDVSEWDKEE